MRSTYGRLRLPELDLSNAPVDQYFMAALKQLNPDEQAAIKTADLVDLAGLYFEAQLMHYAAAEWVDYCIDRVPYDIRPYRADIELGTTLSEVTLKRHAVTVPALVFRDLNEIQKALDGLNPDRAEFWKAARPNMVLAFRLALKVLAFNLRKKEDRK